MTKISLKNVSLCKYKKLTLALIGFALLAASACSGGNEERIVLPIIDENSSIETVKTETASSAKKQPNFARLFAEPFPGLVSGLNDGDVFTVDLDVCAAADEGWDGQEIDPLGRLKCGTKYSLSFDTTTSEWSSTGIDEYLDEVGKPALHTHLRKGGVPANSSIYVWGVKLQALEDGRVLTREGEYVGHIFAGAP